jgi:hypothetical protein
MDNIHEPTDNFSFETLKLSKPVTAPGGSYFIRFTVNNAPLYIQPPKCKTKQGFLKTGKRYYTDLIFTSDNDEFIRWMETLEATCHTHLFANREKWFEGDMEMPEIENYFTSPMKIYKTGKYYTVRVNVQTNLGVPALTIYDEDSREISIDAVDDKTDIITILEIKGIKCTATSFQIDIEMKQMLSVKPVELFTKCIIKTPNRPLPGLPSLAQETGLAERSLASKTVTVADDISVEQHQHDTTPTSRIVLTDVPIIVSPPADLASSVKDLDKMHPTEPPANKPSEPKHSPMPVQEQIREVAPTRPDANENITINTDSYNVETNMGLEEFTIDLDSLTDQENVVIKKSNDVYYEMYREACRKAKIARDLALSSYLEAKRIKNTYMLEDLTDSDESDLEQDSVVE